MTSNSIQLCGRYCPKFGVTLKRSTSIGTDTEAALAEEAGRVETPCCRFASKVTSSNQEGLEKLLQLALSEEFRKYFILSLLCLPRWFLG